MLEFLRDFLNASYLFTQSSLQIFQIAGLIHSSHLDPPFHQPLRLSPSRAIAATGGGGGGGHQLLHHLRRGPVHGREVAGDAHGEAAFAQGTGRLGKVYKKPWKQREKTMQLLCFFSLKKGDFQKSQETQLATIGTPSFPPLPHISPCPATGTACCWTDWTGSALPRPPANRRSSC